LADPTRIQRIRERAHAIWDDAGRSDGSDREHWLQAEAEIAAEERGLGGALPVAGVSRRRAGKAARAAAATVGEEAGKTRPGSSRLPSSR
jgi:hypothetical protein